jgi:hypothetical protein
MERLFEELVAALSPLQTSRSEHSRVCLVDGRNAAL